MRIKNKLCFSLLMAFTFLFISIGCNKNIESEMTDHENPTNPAVEEGTANLKITLASNHTLKSTTAYNAVNVEIQQISFHTSGDTNVASGWYDMETIPGIYNLMDYVVDDTLVAFDSLVAIQTISQLRLLLGDSNTVMIDSVLYDLQTPAGQSSGLKIQVHTEMQPDSAYVIMLDFDPEESVHSTGNNKYKLRPVIRAIVNPE